MEKHGEGEGRGEGACECGASSRRIPALEEAVVRKFGKKKGFFTVFVREAIRRAVDEVLQEKA